MNPVLLPVKYRRRARSSRTVWNTAPHVPVKAPPSNTPLSRVTWPPNGKGPGTLARALTSTSLASIHSTRSSHPFLALAAGRAQPLRWRLEPTNQVCAMSGLGKVVVVVVVGGGREGAVVRNFRFGLGNASYCSSCNPMPPPTASHVTLDSRQPQFIT